MNIIRAETMGFCAGVRRAVNCAEKALEDNKTGSVYTLGPLIHNPVALKKLSDKNLKILEEDDFSLLTSGDTVLIRAHGVPPEKERAIKKLGCNVINATCPLVTMSQKRAAEYAEKGYFIFFAGDKNHGEVVGIEGYAKEASALNSNDFNFVLIKDEGDLTSVVASLIQTEKLNKDSKIVLLSQTTFSISKFEKIREKLKEFFPDSEVVSSICPATHERQDSLVKLCEKVDGVIVIGGKNSANTTRLFVTAQKLCSNAALIENASEIPDIFYTLNTVGLTAGASTPDDVIEEVERMLMKA